jgi:transcriptional regulator with XRE-family HTH domain
MAYSTQYIADELKKAREDKGLSQRELSELAGVPQSHISKIENGVVDLRLSSLVELARALDLELALVPRKALSAVRAVVRSTVRSAGGGGQSARKAARELKRLEGVVTAISKMQPPQEELARFRHLIRELDRFRPAVLDVEALRQINKMLRGYKPGEANPDTLRHLIKQLQRVRNAAVHAPDGALEAEEPRAAYSLSEEGDA